MHKGDFAVRLQPAYGLGTGTDEIEAETRLGQGGIAPKNGWIADYPVTPDILGEPRQAVRNAADAKKVAMNSDDALKRFDQVMTEPDSAIQPYSGGVAPPPQGAENYPSPTVINNYYVEQEHRP